MPVHGNRLWLVLTVAGLCSALTADDWPQWRGPNRDGVWAEQGIIETFDRAKLSIRWRAAIANGYSAPTAAGGRVYVTDRIVSPEPAERVHCFDAMTGEKLWSHAYSCEYKGIDRRDGPRAAVTVNDGRAYALGAMGHFHCFDAADGTLLWGKNLQEQYKIRMPEWGIAASPLIDGNFVIVLIGGQGACLVAFDKTTGQEMWTALEDRAGYAAPILIEQAGRRVVVAWTGERIVGLDSGWGTLYWEHPFPPARMIHNISTPVFHDGYLFFTGFFDGSLLLKVAPDRLAVEELWRRRGRSEQDTDALHCCISTPILAGNCIYGIDGYGELRCLDLQTGDRLWESLEVVPKARWATAHMVTNGDRVWMFNERGELIISRLSPDGYEEISRAAMIKPTEGQLDQRGGVCWAHPAFANRHVYARNDEELVCADLSAPLIGGVNPPVQSWFPQAPALGPPQGQVVEVSTVDELVSAVEQATPGQTILVADGHYLLPRYIEIRADDVTLRGASGRRARVVLDGAQSRHRELLGLRSCSDVTIADLTIQNIQCNGFKINSETNVQRLTIHNCIIHNIWQRGVKGVKVPAADREAIRPKGCRIQYCLFYNDRPKRLSDDPADIAQGNYVAGIDVMYAKDWVISDNVFVGIQGRTSEGRGAIFLWFDAQNCLIERNIIIDCDVGLQLGNPHRADGVEVHCVGCTARNNFITRAPEAGIVTVYTKDCRVLHNTIHDPQSRLQRLLRTVFTNDGLVMANNLLSGPGMRNESDSDIEFLNNLVKDMTDAFVDPAHGNLHLMRAASDVVDRAVTRSEVTEDIDGQLRDDQPDIGADEYRDGNLDAGRR